MTPRMPRTTEEAAVYVEHALCLMTGRSLPCYRDYKKSRMGFQRYLTDAAPSPFLAVDEMAQARHPEIARAVGLHPKADFIPPQQYWPWSALLRRIHYEIRIAAGAPVVVYNHFRPAAYNAKVSPGTDNSDHLKAAAIDCQFGSRSKRGRAEKDVIDPLFKTGLFAMSVGRGSTFLHVGVFAPATLAKGAQRRWRY